MPTNNHHRKEMDVMLCYGVNSCHDVILCYVVIPCHDVTPLCYVMKVYWSSSAWVTRLERAPRLLFCDTAGIAAENVQLYHYLVAFKCFLSIILLTFSAVGKYIWRKKTWVKEGRPLQVRNSRRNHRSECKLGFFLFHPLLRKEW